MLAIVLGIVIVALDQLTKWLVSSRMELFAEIPVIHGFFSLEYVHNPGAAFGMLANQRWLFVLIGVAASAAIVYYSRQPEARRGVMPWALGILLGGTVGNLIDRMLTGEVVDFFLFYWKDYRFPNFNVADIAINVGVGLFILHLIFTGEKSQREGA